MSDHRKNMEKYKTISTILEAEILRIVQTLMNERNALRSEVIGSRADVIDAEKNLEEKEKIIAMLRKQLSDNDKWSISIKKSENITF